MKKFNLYEHNKKYMDIAKQAAKGSYPSKKVAFVGSILGGIIGGILLLVGIVATLAGYTWGIGSFIAGGATGLSNLYNLKRLQSK